MFVEEKRVKNERPNVFYEPLSPTLANKPNLRSKNEDEMAQFSTRYTMGTVDHTGQGFKSDKFIGKLMPSYSKEENVDKRKNKRYSEQFSNCNS